MKQTETHTLLKYVICKILRIYIRNGIWIKRRPWTKYNVKKAFILFPMTCISVCYFFYPTCCCFFCVVVAACHKILAKKTDLNVKHSGIMTKDTQQVIVVRIKHTWLSVSLKNADKTCYSMKKMLVYFMNVPSTHVYFIRGQSAAELFDFHNPWKIENHRKKKQQQLILSN